MGGVSSTSIVRDCSLVLFGGIYSANQIKVETFPDVTFPALFVQTTYPGASTQDVESEITIPIEKTLINLKGFDDLTSTSSDNFSSIFLIYSFDQDMEKTEQEAVDAIANVDLPDGAEVQVMRMSPGAMPVYQVAVTAEQNDDLQTLLEEEIVPSIENVAGVSSVSLQGTKETELSIIVDEEKTQKYNLTLKDIKDRISSQEYAFPLGSVNQKENTVPVRLVGTIDSVAALEDLTFTVTASPMPVQQQQTPANQQSSGMNQPQPRGANQAGPEQIKLSEIALIEQTTKQTEITRFNGQESYIIEVMKTQDANTAEVVNKIKELLETYKTRDNVNLHVIMDQGAEVEKSVSTLIKEGSYGALFTVIVMYSYETFGGVFPSLFPSRRVFDINIPIGRFDLNPCAGKCLL
jgi:multidrug efflux pump subunit AcrB